VNVPEMARPRFSFENPVTRCCLWLVFQMQAALLRKKIVLTRDLAVLSRHRKIAAGFPDDSLDYVRVSTLELIAHEIRSRGVAGACAELGVFRGHFASRINEFFPDRTLYLFDTFDGFCADQVDADKARGYVHTEQDFSSTKLESVLVRMPNRNRCVPRVGRFPGTACGLENERFAFVSLDPDLFEPTYAGLQFFFPRLSDGGSILVHDYNDDLYAGVRAAVDRFLSENRCAFVPVSDHYGSALIVK